MILFIMHKVSSYKSFKNLLNYIIIVLCVKTITVVVHNMTLCNNREKVVEKK